MRRGRHPVLFCSAVVSLLLCGLACAAWARSFYVVERVGRVHYAPAVETEDHHLYLLANWGVAELTGGGDPAENFPHVRWQWDRYPAYAGGHIGGDQPRWLGRLGIGWSREQKLTTGETTWSLYVRLKSAAAALGLMTALLAWRWWRVTRVVPGVCGVCGYDLRASPGRCPECGTEREPAPATEILTPARAPTSASAGSPPSSAGRTDR